MSSIVAIIQARMGSSRLPGKVMADVAGRPLIGRMLDRVARCRTLDEIWVACSESANDDPLVRFLQSEGHQFHRGSEWDVLSRYVAVARQTSAEAVVRLTGDCPLIDPELVDAVVSNYLAGGCDYVSNTLERTFPDGLDTEVFSRESLEEADAKALHPFLREHVVPYIHGRHGQPLPSGNFVRRQVTSGADFSHLRWTVDEAEDLEFVRQVYERLLTAKPDFGWLDVVAVLTREPHLLALTSHRIPNEGSQRSWDRWQRTLSSIPPRA